MTPNYYFINITIMHNYPPQNIAGSINYVIDTVQVPFSFARTFWISNFIDAENDKIFIDCSSRLMNSTVNATWTNCDENATTGNITIWGNIPGDNNWAGDYVFTIVVTDIFKDGNFTSYSFTMTVTKKPSIVVTCGVANVTSRLPNGTSVCTFPCNYDFDGLPYRAILHINNTLWTNSTYGSWFQWNETLQISTTTPYANTQAGPHQIGIKLDDNITTPLWINYT